MTTSTSRRTATLHALILGLFALGAAHDGIAAGPAEAAALLEHASAPLRGAASSRSSFSYELSMPNPQRHEFHVRLRFDDLPGDKARLELPKWNPGAYRLTDAHRNIRAVSARLVDAEQEIPVGVAKLDENTWEVAHEGKALVVEYRAYCGSYTGIAGCYLDDEFGFANGVYLFMYAVGHKHEPIDLRVSELPGGKGAEVVTGLPRRGNSKKNQFWASNYDVLVDSPIHAGVVDTIEFELGGRPVRATMSREGAWKPDEVRDELRAITETAAEIFGPVETAIPFTDYTFIYHVLPDNGAGLEHLNSTAISVDPWWFSDERGKRRFWSVSAHEFFHLWNVKRIRPAVLGPFDYDREVHTTMLWFSEGFTSYYSILIMRRAGLIDEKQALHDLARRIAAVETRAGRKLMSVEQSSWETWAKPDDGGKAYFSYYDKGAVIGMLFDLHLRQTTGGRASTDTVFRELWQRWRDTGLGLGPAQLELAFIDQAGAGADDMLQLYADYVHGTAELDYDRFLAHAGYRLKRTIKHPGPWIGASTARVNGRVRFDIVDHGGPGDRGGLADGDMLVAIDGHPVDTAHYEEILGALELGERHAFTVERMGRVVELDIEPIEGGEEKFEIVDLDEVTAEQTMLRRKWLGLD